MVSPDGKWVAWSWSHLGPAADVFATPTDGSEVPVRLTNTLDDTYVVSWTVDSKALIVEQDHDGDERAQLSLIRLSEPEVMNPLTEDSPNFYIRGGQMHPNGRWLVYGANLDAGTGEEIQPSWVYRHDLETRERRALACPKKSGFYGPQLSPSGDLIFYYRSEEHPSGRQVWLVDIEGAEDREILNFGPRAKVSASWFPDGRRILFTAEAETHRRLGVWEGGAVRWLLDNPERDIEYALVPPNGGPAVVAEIERSRTRASLLDADSGDETGVDLRSGALIPLAPTHEGWIGLRYDSRNPMDLVNFDPEGSRTTRSITGLWDRTPLEPVDLVQAKDFTWKSVDGLEIQGWLYQSRNESKGTIVLVHGGPTSHSEDRFSAQIQYFASRGFDVLAPNYRGSTGFGLAFQEQIKEDGWGGREQEDIRCGIEALIEAGISKPGKVGITGTSYGGYSAWCAITRYPLDLIAASTPICGMTDLVVDYYSTRPDLRPYSEEMMGGSPEEVPDRYRKGSPIHFVENIRGELLIVQGQRDPNVTPENVHAVTKELEKHGISYELLTFEDEGHGIGRPENLKVLYPRLADFFENAFSTRRD